MKRLQRNEILAHINWEIDIANREMPFYQKIQRAVFHIGMESSDDWVPIEECRSFCVVCPAMLDHTYRCKSGHGNRQ